jgi:hypothetical protein
MKVETRGVWRPLLLVWAVVFGFAVPGQVAGQATPEPSASPVAASEGYTPVIQSVHTAPQWFWGSDDRVHLVYELFLTNAFPVPVTVTGIDVLDTASDGSIISLEGDTLAGSMSLLTSGNEPATTLQPSSVGVVWFDIPLAGQEAIPAVIEHQLTVSVPPGLPVPETIESRGARAEVDVREPIVIGAPLMGPQWAAIGSCCDGPHRRAFQPINGELQLAQRFAIDFNLLDAENRLTFGDPTRNESAPGFGQPVIAVADAVVVRALDGLPDQKPGSPLVDITLETADGNHVILDLGDGRYGFYAHLKSGSVAVQEGDRVTKGQVIGELGNSGSSDGAHLHFHVMDAPSALGANGMPYVFEEFDLTGQLPSLAEMAPLYEAQQSIPVDTDVAGPRERELPLGGNVMTFPSD